MMEIVLYSKSQLNNSSILNSFKKVKQISITSRLDQVGQKKLVSKIKELIQLEKLILILDSHNSESTRYQVIKSIENLENLKELSLEMGHFETEDARNLGKLFKKLHRLESLKIINFDNWNIEQEGIIGLQKGFQQLKNLKKFNISVNQNNQINFQNINEMLYSFNTLTHLVVYATSKLNEKQESQALKSLISKQINLTHLHLNLQDRYYKYDENLVSIVGDSLKNLYELTNLTIILQLDNISKQQFINFKNSLQKINNLIEFIFEFSSQLDLLYTNPLVILDGLQMHKKLKKVDFYSLIPYDENDDYSFKFSQVEKLYLDLKFNKQLSIEQSRNLCYGLRSFKNLTILKFTFDKSQRISISEIVREFGKALKRMKNLIDLELIFFQDCQIGLGATQKIARGISELKNLKNLSLIFEVYNYIGEEGSKSIGDALKQLSNLNDFEIIFGNYKEIGSQGLQGLSQGVQCLQNLKMLSIKTKDSSYQAYYDIKYFGECVLNLKNLIDLELELPIDIKKNKSVEVFSQYLATLQNLQNLKISFKAYVESKGISSMLKTLNVLIFLQNIKLSFSHIEEYNQRDVIESLFQSFSNVKSLISVDLFFEELNFNQKPKNLAKYIQNMINLKYFSFQFDIIQTNSLQPFINLFKRKLTRLVQFKSNFNENEQEFNSSYSNDSSPSISSVEEEINEEFQPQLSNEDISDHIYNDEEENLNIFMQ